MFECHQKNDVHAFLSTFTPVHVEQCEYEIDAKSRAFHRQEKESGRTRLQCDWFLVRYRHRVSLCRAVKLRSNNERRNRELSSIHIKASNLEE